MTGWQMYGNGFMVSTMPVIMKYAFYVMGVYYILIAYKACTGRQKKHAVFAEYQSFYGTFAYDNGGIFL